jgi:hypothetical protein
MNLTTTLLLKIVIDLNFQNQPQTIPVCPPTHDRAFDNGRKCCSYNENHKIVYAVLPRQSQVCPSGRAINCPQGHNCEDNPPSCLSELSLEGFGPDYDGGYSSTRDRFENAKQIYQLGYPDYRTLSSISEKCIWWLLQSRQWHIGECNNVGTNESFAYIYADVPCPHPEEERWVHSETGEYLKNIHNYSNDRCKVNPDGPSVCGAEYSLPLDTSATTGVNAIIRNGAYIQTCTWKLRRHQWRCI